MGDFATPNLPSRDFAATIAFYTRLGFRTEWHDEAWLILSRGTIMLEFFPYPDLYPLSSSFGACLRLDDLDGFYAVARAAGIPVTNTGMPRLHPPKLEPWGRRRAALIDPDGTLLHLIAAVGSD